MIKLSNFPFKTQKTVPNGSDNKSTWILLQAGFIRQTMAWVYTYTTLGLKVLRKIENIVREEMDNYGVAETLMPALSPKELWDKTGRWDSIDVFFHVPAANNKEYGLNSTHEEIVTPLVWEFIQSYKDLPTSVYQIQNKFRNEKRAKSWILRWREFLMKDAYSFHLSNEDFEKYYEWMKEVYLNIFKRIGLWEDTIIALADWWTFTEKFSHEFQVKIDIWEDVIYKDNKTWICYNQEITPVKVGKENVADSELLEKKDIKHSSDIIWVEALEKFLWVPKEKTTKTLFFETAEGKFIVASVRWDYEINTLKLQKILWTTSLVFASEEKVKEITGAEIGYAWIINLPENVDIYLDDSIEWLTNFETWTNKTGFHTININFWKDLELPQKFYDFKDAKIWDKNPETWEIYEVFKASEIWNIFPLETKFTKAFGVQYLGEDNKMQTPLMGCYGIWVSRAMWLVAEKYATEKGIKWPENIAPVKYYIAVIWEENIEKAYELIEKLKLDKSEIILDDRMWRKIGFGQKMWDAELLWIPNVIVISKKTLEQDSYELNWELIKF